MADTCADQLGSAFEDVAGTTHAEAIACVDGWSLAAGYEDGTFQPGRTLTLAQAATFLVRTLEGAGHALPPPTTRSCVDRPAHGLAIDALVAAGIAGPTTCVEGSRPITRGEMAAWVSGALDVAGGTPGEERRWYLDVDGHRFATAIRRVTAEGIVTGHRDGTFAPDADLSRGQMATFLTRLLDRLLEL